MLYPGERELNAIERDLRLEAILTDVVALGRKRVYGELLWHALHKGWAKGWAYHAFIEIYGTEPRPQDRCAPICCIGGPVEQWIALRPKKARSNKQRRREHDDRGGAASP
jgi:hypothetical protein